MAQRSSTKISSVVDAWDLLAERFNTHKNDPCDIHPDAAVNIFVGWPVFFEQIKYHKAYMGKDRLAIMDFGCGAGQFCNKLHSMGYEAVGTDRSETMLQLAKANTTSGIRYCFDYECDIYKNKIDIVTSMHVLDWIEDVDCAVKKISSYLVKDGLFLFSVFPKKHVIESLQIKDLFEDFDSGTDPSKGFCNFDGVRVPVFVKDASYYDCLFKKLDFEKVIECYPTFPKWFLKEYEWTGAKYPEMMILGYRKN